MGHQHRTSASPIRPAWWQLKLLNRVMPLTLITGSLGIGISVYRYLSGSAPLISLVSLAGAVGLLASLSAPRRLPYPLRVGNLIFVFLFAGLYFLWLTGFSVGIGALLAFACLASAVFLHLKFACVTLAIAMAGWLAVGGLVAMGLPSPHANHLIQYNQIAHTLGAVNGALLLGLIISMAISAVLRLLEAEFGEIRSANQALSEARQRREQADSVTRQRQRALIDHSRLAGLGRLSTEIANTLGEIQEAMLQNTAAFTPALVRAQADDLKQDLEEAFEVTTGLLTQLRSYGGQVIQPSPEPTPASTLLRSAYRTAQRIMPPEVKVLPVQTHESELMLEADSGQLLQVLTNLIINARDAMPDGGTLKLSMEVDAPTEGAQDNQMVRFVVADTGVGMSETVCARIFDPFFSTKGPEKGSGLGLATAYSIAHQHKGSLQVDSTPGAGSTFTLELPLQMAG